MQIYKQIDVQHHGHRYLRILSICLAAAAPLESWDDKIPNANQRFKVLTGFGGAAVLDKETQLVWEKSPATSVHNWLTARIQCTGRTTGGRKGWRLPSVHEQASLIDPSLRPRPDPTAASSWRRPRYRSIGRSRTRNRHTCR
ncbi:MAG: hypothetical protein A4E19_02295 [Nitrospira sp. SG-bin1]|nr:MAG: hypothetical protein A4E19_02295 [Nitrospira sp. SG-bin1]